MAGTEIWLDDEGSEAPEGREESLESWVLARAEEYRNFYDSNYREKDEEYYRIWRGIWAREDQQRSSERSRIVSPATQQAVESSVAEVEEATFGRGSFFRIDDEVMDEQKEDVAKLEILLKEKFKKHKIRKDVSEVLLTSAIYGYGAAEVVVEEVEDRSPAIRPALDGQLTAVGAETKTVTKVTLVPISPNNLLLDPTATTLEDGLGIGIERFVPMHTVEALQEAGVYNPCYLGNAPSEMELEVDKELSQYAQDGKVKLLKWFGKVPTKLLRKAQKEAEEETSDIAGVEFVTLSVTPEGEDEPEYTEAIIVMGNSKLLKAEENPYLMQDRSVIGFAWDTIPGLIRGRGVVEKGYNSQKAIDAELRSRIDGLALTTHPMLAMDARRLPRGGDFKVRPGKTILTQGDPREILHSFKFGEISQNTFAQTASLERMHQSATGAVDSSGIGGGVNGEATAAGISMSLGAIIKRHKRTLLNFQECFLIPLVEKAAWRYMQFAPEEFPIGDYSFIASSALGIMAREYEVSQLVQLLQTVSPDSPVYVPLLTQVIDNMNLSEREKLIGTLEASMQPTPEQQEAQQKAQAAEEERRVAEVELLRGQTEEFLARANKYNKEAEMSPLETEIKMLNSIEDAESKELEKNLKIVDRRLKEKQLNIQSNQQRKP